jgi:hypothetical protein
VNTWHAQGFVGSAIACLWLAACQAYDPSLLEGSAGGSAGGGGSAPPNVACGDGVVGANERCDTGIAPGQPGACPKDCPDLSPCLRREPSGTGCKVTCVILPVPSCGDGDGCCAPTCNKLNDPDCSASCGDQIVQAAMGETCEPNTSQPCPTTCEDGSPCTRDMLGGATHNCNVTCDNVPITDLIGGDGCCPPGGTPQADSDCN